MIDQEADTIPIPVIPEPVPGIHFGWDANEDGTVDEFEAKVPEPLVLRGAIATGVGLLTAATGYALDQAWVELFVGVYAFVAPIGLAFWARRHVTPYGRHSRK